LVINEGIYNDISNYSLLSEFQLREYVDTACHRHGETQKIKVADSINQDDTTIPLDLAGCMIHFMHRLRTKEEVTSLKQLCLA
jgi:ABC-type Na+ transport system ATPase subunit NatA